MRVLLGFPLFLGYGSVMCSVVFVHDVTITELCIIFKVMSLKIVMMFLGRDRARLDWIWCLLYILGSDICV